MNYLRTILICTLLYSSSFAQEVRIPLLVTPEEIGARVITALKSRDVKPLIDAVSASGIVVGTDEPKMSAAMFSKQLQQKRGVYCVLMDNACIGSGSKSTEDNSLRGLILRQPIKLESHAVGDASGNVEIRVVKEANPRDVIFSIFFEKEKDGWKIVNIEYI
jgi:hypothetical protein